MDRGGRRSSSLIVTGIASALVAGTLWASPATADHGGPALDCPEVMPVSEVTRGMTGLGWTVAEGRHRESFDVEVLGIFEDAYPGRDLIIVDTSGPLIDAVGGIWHGMSGSPVYVGDRLLGAMAFGVSYGPSSIGALTPAEEMFRVFDYGEGGDQEGNEDSAAAATPRRVSIPSATRRAISRQTEGEDVGPSFVQLKVPVSISGIPGRAMNKVRRAVKRERLPVIPYAGTAASSGSGFQPAPALHAGDNIAATLSYGDVTFAGVGTATAVCDGRAMAFGHPFFWEGETTIGANAADSLAVIGDPFYSYELATVAEGIGLIDQDRFAGIRAALGMNPPTIPIESTVTAGGRTQDGRTDAVISEVVPFVSWMHLYGNLLFTLDEYSEGHSNLSWTITGTTSTGSPWELSRSNMYESEYDIAGTSSYELEGILYTLFYNDFEDVEFTGIDVTGTVEDEIEKYTVTNILVSTDGVEYLDKRKVRAEPGSTIYLQAVLTPYESTEERIVDLSVIVPEKIRADGVIEIGHRRYESFLCLYRPKRCLDETGGKIDSFEQLVAALEAGPTNNELTARLRMGRRGRIVASDSELLDQVVSKLKRVILDVPGARNHRGEEGKER